MWFDTVSPALFTHCFIYVDRFHRHARHYVAVPPVLHRRVAGPVTALPALQHLGRGRGGLARHRSSGGRGGSSSAPPKRVRRPPGCRCGEQPALSSDSQAVAMNELNLPPCPPPLSSLLADAKISRKTGSVLEMPCADGCHDLLHRSKSGLKTNADTSSPNRSCSGERRRRGLW